MWFWLYFSATFIPKTDSKLLPVAPLQMTSVGKNHHHNKQPHHMETQCWWCRDRNQGGCSNNKDESKGKLPTPWRCYLNGCDWEGGWCICLARHASFTGASHGKSLWASIPPRESVYLHNPQVTLAQAGPDRRIHPRQGGLQRNAPSSCWREVVPDLNTVVWTSQVAMIQNLRRSGSFCVTTKDCVWVINVCCLCESLSVWGVSMSYYKPNET